MSKVRIEDTAMSSAGAHEVTAMKSVINNATAPDFPRSVLAAKAAARPAETWLGAIACGYVGKLGLSVSVTAASPRVVANPNGIANHASPPKTYVRTAVIGRLAIARCQYA
jgi:hypothetical protein